MLESCSLGSTKRELVARVCGLEKFKDNDSGGISMIYVAFLSPSSLAAAHAHIMTGSGLAFTILQIKKSFESARDERPQDFTFFPPHYTGKLSFSLTRLDFFPFRLLRKLHSSDYRQQQLWGKKILHKFSFCSLWPSEWPKVRQIYRFLEISWLCGLCSRSRSLLLRFEASQNTFFL